MTASDDIYARAEFLRTRALADCGGDAAKALFALSVESAMRERALKAAVSPGFIRDGLPRGQVGTASEPEAL